VACFVAAIAEALSFDPPACAHPVRVAVLWTIPCAFPGVISRPIFSFLQKEVLDGVSVFDDAIVAVVAVAGFSFLRVLLLGVVTGRNDGGVRRLRRGRDDEVGRQNDGERAVEHGFDDGVEVDEAIVDHRSIVVRHAGFEPALDAYFDGENEFGGKFIVAGDASLEDDLVSAYAVDEPRDSVHEGTLFPK